jgi:uncharacterized protein (DUF2236 family)
MVDLFIQQMVRQLVGGSGPPTAFLTPAGDPGLLGPDSMPWEVHADFMAMMIGGISSLVLQALHPGALAGVWDHSSFRTDLQGRLGRTAFFIAATTYGPTAMANQMIDKVNRIHGHITGADEFGKPYSASDPHLLNWVHLTETSSFMRAYLRYRNPHLASADIDRYFDEMRLIGNRLGAVDLPDTALDTDQAIAAYVSELHFGERARAIVTLLDEYPSSLYSRPFVRLVSKAGFLNLPDWAYPLIGRKVPSAFERSAVQSAINLIAKPVRKALQNGVAAHSYRRIYGLNSNKGKSHAAQH